MFYSSFNCAALVVVHVLPIEAKWRSTFQITQKKTKRKEIENLSHCHMQENKKQLCLVKSQLLTMLKTKHTEKITTLQTQLIKTKRHILPSNLVPKKKDSGKQSSQKLEQK